MRRHQQPAIASRARRAGQLVEHGGHVAADVGIAGQQPQVLVEPGGARVVVARPDVGVASDRSLFLADDERELDVRLQALDSVRDVHAFLLQILAPLHVRGLVEACGHFDQDRDLLPSASGLGERANDR